MTSLNFYNWFRGYRDVINEMRMEEPIFTYDGRVTVQVEFKTIAAYTTWIVKRREAAQMLTLDQDAAPPSLVA